MQRYRARISGPLLDRIDIHIEVPRLPTGTLSKPQAPSEDSVTVRARVCAARELQMARAGKANALLSPREVERDCTLTSENQQLLERAADKLRLSARAYHRILKVARTIADLDRAEQIMMPHLTEAIAYRKLDRGV